MYVNGSCWQDPLSRHLFCYLQNLGQKHIILRIFVVLCFTLFSEGVLTLVMPFLSLF